MDLFEDSVDVGGVGLDSLGASLAAGACSLLGRDLCCFLSDCWCFGHFGLLSFLNEKLCALLSFEILQAYQLSVMIF